MCRFRDRSGNSFTFFSSLFFEIRFYFHKVAKHESSTCSISEIFWHQLSNMGSEMRFKIIPGVKRQVTRKETEKPASLYFEIPDVEAKDCKDCEASGGLLTIQFRPSWRYEHPEKYNREKSVLVLSRFGSFVANDKLDSRVSRRQINAFFPNTV